jgi:small-conductance mechanosensitive channel
MAIIQEEAMSHPLYLDNRNEEELEGNHPPVIVRVIALSDYSVDLKAYIWTKGSDHAFMLMCDLLKSVKERFDREGIEIPFPYRTVVYKKDMETNEAPTR